jgi:tetratricopeptide (TPR) repeat protein
MLAMLALHTAVACAPVSRPPAPTASPVPKRPPVSPPSTEVVATEQPPLSNARVASDLPDACRAAIPDDLRRPSIVVTSFAAVGAGDRLGSEVADLVAGIVKRAREQAKKTLRLSSTVDDVSVRVVRCVIQSHTEAIALSEAMNAPLVIWGEASQTDGSTTPVVNVTQVGGYVKATESANISIGTVRLGVGSKSFILQTHSTLHVGNLSAARDASALRVANLLDVTSDHLERGGVVPFVWLVLGLYCDSVEKLDDSFTLLTAVGRLAEENAQQLAVLRFPLALAYMRNGQHSKAEREFGEILNAIGGTRPGEESTIRALLGFSKATRGEWQQAGSDFTLALDLRVRFAPGPDPFSSNMRAFLALSKIATGDPTGPALLHAAASELHGFGLDAESCLGDVYTFVGAIHSLNGDIDGAVKYATMALDIAKKDSNWQERIASYSANLARFLLAKGDVSTACQLLAEARQITVAVFGDRHVNVAKRDHELGAALNRATRIEEAAEAFGRALREYLSLAPEQRRDNADLLARIANDLSPLVVGLSGGSSASGLRIAAGPVPPSALASLRAGDRVVRYAGTVVRNARELESAMRANAAFSTPREIVVERDQQTLIISVPRGPLSVWFLEPGSAPLKNSSTVYRGISGAIVLL